MSFNHPIIKFLRYLLFPISVLYALVLWIRHQLFNRNIFHSVKFDRTVICVGNISAGGTGKTPMVEWIIRQLKDEFKIGMVSRGYGRKTKGFLLADAQSTAKEIGDEPLQIFQKFPFLKLAVGEERVPAISRLIELHPETEVILLDDAYQHRWVKASINIVLTTYDRLYTEDFILPTGYLRDLPSAANRAEVIVVTKCPSNISESEKQNIRQRLKIQSHQQLYFSYIAYGELIDGKTRTPLVVESFQRILMVTGIANPAQMEYYLKQWQKEIKQKTYSDHYEFQQSDITELESMYQKMGEGTLMVTTEKDAVRLEKFNLTMKWAVLPIETKFFDEKLPLKEWLVQQIHQTNTN